MHAQSTVVLLLDNEFLITISDVVQYFPEGIVSTPSPPPTQSGPTRSHCLLITRTSLLIPLLISMFALLKAIFHITDERIFLNVNGISGYLPNLSSFPPLSESNSNLPPSTVPGT